jgi:hypothetical protein
MKEIIKIKPGKAEISDPGLNESFKQWVRIMSTGRILNMLKFSWITWVWSIKSLKIAINKSLCIMGFYGIKGYGKSNKREKNEIRIQG